MRALIPAIRRWWMQLCMIAAIGAVLSASVWWSSAERSAALEDFSHEQAALATAVSVDFEHRLALKETQAKSGQLLHDEEVLDLLRGPAQRLEERGKLLILAARPHEEGFVTTDHRVIPSSHLRASLDRGDTSVIVPRDEAASFGLPRRMAVAGLARTNHASSWGIVVLATAERIRDRERQESWRLAITVVAVTVVAAAFGALLRRRQWRELDLERQIALSALARENEVALAHADKMASLAALSTGIAHEIGTPLAVLDGRVEQALARPSVTSDERATAALKTALEQVQRMRRAVTGLLALARGDAPALVTTAPREVAERAIELVRHRFEQAKVELACVIADDVPSIACEPSLFEQALVNVLLNASQATPSGGHVRLEVRRDAERHVIFVVDDEGPGIPDDIAHRATEPFFSTKREKGGSGLGLTIAREIVSHHAGTLTLTKREGGGTRATISINA